MGAHDETSPAVSHELFLPCVVAEFARPRDDMEFPQELTGPGIVAHDVAWHVLDPCLVVTLLVGITHHDHVVYHYGRRRTGDHSYFPGNSRVMVERLAELLKGKPAPHQIFQRVNDPGLGKSLHRHGPAESLQRQTGLGVERVEEEAGSRDVDHPAAIDLGVGDSLSIVLPHGALKAQRVGLAEGPKGLTRSRIDGDHLPPLAGHSVEDTVDEDGRGFEGVVDRGAEVVRPPDPSDLQIFEVAGVDLVQG